MARLILRHAVALTALLPAFVGCGPQGADLPSLGELDAPSPTEFRGGLVGENLGGVNLGGVNLGGVNLGGVNLGGPNLGGVNLGATNLGAVNLGGTNLGGPNLGGVNLGATNLGATNLGGVNLGGVNLGGVNLGATNLGGVNLGAPNLGGVNLGATNLGGVNLSTPNVGLNIHGAGPPGLLYSGEDTWTNRPSSCVVMGIGSTALARLVAQNTGAKMYAAIKQLPWGFASSPGGPVTANAWEALVWGSTRYCSFILMVPPGATHAGVAGFVKAVFRWNAPPAKTIDIGQIGGGQPIATYTGMMGAGAQVLSGSISEKAFLAGEFAFITATTNNVSVNVDFATWVRGNDNNPRVLGDVSGAPLYADGAFQAVELPDGSVSIYLERSRLMNGGTLATTPKAIQNKYSLSQLGLSAPPIPKRCSGALTLRELGGDPLHALLKCDAYVVADSGLVPGGLYDNWSNALLVPSRYHDRMGLEAPGLKEEPGYAMGRETWVTGPGMLMESRFESVYPVISETYVHLNDEPYSNREWLNRSGATGPRCRDGSGTADGRAGACVSTTASAASPADGDVWLWNTGTWTKQTLPGTRVFRREGVTFVINSKGELWAKGDYVTTWSKHTASCRDVAMSSASARQFCVTYSASAPTADAQIKWRTSLTATWANAGTMTGNAVAMDGDGTGYVAKGAGGVYRTANGTTWTQISSAVCKDLSIGSGFLYCIDGSKNLLRLNPTTSAFEAVGKTANSVNVDANGNPWVVDATGVLFHNL